MFSYSANGKAGVPCRLSLTGCNGDIRKQLERHSGFNNWLLHKEEKSYIEVFENRKEDLVYLTADAETVLESLDASKIYIVGGLVDRNRWKGITAEKAARQGIATAKLPIADHMKMLSSQVRLQAFSRIPRCIIPIIFSCIPPPAWPFYILKIFAFFCDTGISSLNILGEAFLIHVAVDCSLAGSHFRGRYLELDNNVIDIVFRVCRCSR